MLFCSIYMSFRGLYLCLVCNLIFLFCCLILLGYIRHSVFLLL